MLTQLHSALIVRLTKQQPPTKRPTTMSILIALIDWILGLDGRDHQDEDQ